LQYCLITSGLHLLIAGVGGGKKRAAWDLKGRLQDMEAAMTQLLKQKENLEMETCTSGDRLAQMEELNNKLQGAVVEKDSEAQSIQQRAARLQQQLRWVAVSAGVRLS